MKNASRLAAAAVGLISATVVLSAAAADFRTDSEAAAPIGESFSEAASTTAEQTVALTTSADSGSAHPADSAAIGPCTFASGARLDDAAAADPVADRHGGVGFDTAHCVTDRVGTAWAVAWNSAQPPVGGLFRFVPTATRWQLLELGSLGNCVAQHGVPAEIAAQLPGC